MEVMITGPAKEKFIACIDILGYTSMKESALAGTVITLPELANLRNLLCLPSDRDQFTIDGPTVCPCSRFLSRDLDFQIFHQQDDDSSIISTEISPGGAINLVRHCSALVLRLLKRGVLCRGSIIWGFIHHTSTSCEGPGRDDLIAREKLVRAFHGDENETGTPFVEVDHAVCEYVEFCEDLCVKEMFSRHVEGDGETVALFPFKRLVSPFLGSFGPRDVEKDKQSIRTIQELIGIMKTRVKSFMGKADEKARRKCDHYLRALDDQLTLCEEALDDLEAPFPSKNMADIS